MYTCGITPYDATHLGHAATFIAYDVLQRRLIDLGHTVRCVRNVTDVDDPLFAKARELGDPLPRPRRRRGGAVQPRHGGAQRAAGVQHAARIVGDPRHPRLHRHGARPWLRLRGRRQRVLRRVEESRRSARSATTRAAQMLEYRPRARRQRRRPAQAQPARLRAVAPVRRRRAELGHDVGTGPTGLAHRVQRARAARARHDDRPPRRRQRPDLPAPRVRAGAERGRDRRAVRAALDARRDGVHGRPQDVEEPRQPRVRRQAAHRVGSACDPPRDHRAPLPREWEWDTR